MIILANKSTNDKSDLILTVCLLWEIRIFRESSAQIPTSSLLRNTSLYKSTAELGHGCIQSNSVVADCARIVSLYSGNLLISTDCSIAIAS